MSRHFNYPVNLIKQPEGGYVVTFPDFSEAITQGDTVDDALQEASDCLEEAVANRMAMKLDIPNPKRTKKKSRFVGLHATLAAKAALYITMNKNKVSKVALAKKLKCDEKEVRRLLDPHYHSKFPKIEHALHVLGLKLDIRILRRKSES